MGHDVAISAFHGQQGGMGEWEGFPVYPAGDHPYGGDVVGLHARHFGASWVIPIMDFWAVSTDTLIRLNVASPQHSMIGITKEAPKCLACKPTTSPPDT